jgi:hypothetical protein
MVARCPRKQNNEIAQIILNPTSAAAIINEFEIKCGSRGSLKLLYVVMIPTPMLSEKKI